MVRGSERHPRAPHKPRVHRYLVALTENTHWIIDYDEKRYMRIPRRDRPTPDSVGGRLEDGVWHSYWTAKIVKYPDVGVGLHESRLQLKTPDLPMEGQQGIFSGPIERMGRCHEKPEEMFE